jgi:hypothetical protein
MIPRRNGLGRGRKKNRNKAPATVLFTHEVNDKGHRQICVYAQCQLSGIAHGPVWGHGDNSVKRVLAELTAECDCPAMYHMNKEQQGFRKLKGPS